MQSFRQYRQLRDRVVIASRPDPLKSSPTNVSSYQTKDIERSTIPYDTLSSTGKSLGNEKSDLENEDEPIIVGWDGSDDPSNPRNWSLARKIWVFIILWINVFAVDWAASADSQAASTISRKFHVSEEAESLSPSLYTFGLAAGSVFAAPIAETVGKNPIYVLSRCLHVVWLLGVALAPDFGYVGIVVLSCVLPFANFHNLRGQCVFRLLAGLSASILLAIHAASIADLFGPVQRTIAWPSIALASFWGTSLSPVAGGWIAEARATDWRLTEWVALILSGSTLILTLLFLPETFSPILLSWKACHLREHTGNSRYRAEIEFQETLSRRFQAASLRALHMVTREPIVVLLGAWIVIEYVVVYGFLQGFNYIFGDTHDFKRGLVGSSFVAIAIGCGLWTLGIPVYYLLYKRKTFHIHQQDSQSGSSPGDIHKANNPGVDLPQPEYRLWTALLAAPAFPISLFWLGWTNYAWISPWSNLGAVVLLGFSWAGIYVTVYQYILDVYGIYAGSALAAITCWRFSASGLINMVSRYMYTGIGVHWVATLLGCLAALLMPLPLIFYRYGPNIRRRSAFASDHDRSQNSRSKIGSRAKWKD